MSNLIALHILLTFPSGDDLNSTAVSPHTEPETATSGSGGRPWPSPACATCAGPLCASPSPRSRSRRCPSPRGSWNTSPIKTSPNASGTAPPPLMTRRRTGSLEEERAALSSQKAFIFGFGFLMENCRIKKENPLVYSTLNNPALRVSFIALLL